MSSITIRKGWAFMNKIKFLSHGLFKKNIKKIKRKFKRKATSATSNIIIINCLFVIAILALFSALETKVKNKTGRMLWKRTGHKR